MVRVFTEIPHFGWTVGVAFKEDAIIDQRVRPAISSTSFLYCGSIDDCCPLVLISKIVSPLGVIRSAMDNMAEGNLNAYADVKSKDEFGQLADNFNVMSSKVRDIIILVNSSVDEVRLSAERLSASAEETNAVSEQMAGAIDDIASGATKSAHDTEDVTQTVDHLGEQIVGIHGKASIMTGIAREAEQVNKSGLSQVNQFQPFVLWLKDKSCNRWRMLLENWKRKWVQLALSWRQLLKFPRRRICWRLMRVLRQRVLVNMAKALRLWQKK